MENASPELLQPARWSLSQKSSKGAWAMGTARGTSRTHPRSGSKHQPLLLQELESVGADWKPTATGAVAAISSEAVASHGKPRRRAIMAGGTLITWSGVARAILRS